MFRRLVPAVVAASLIVACGGEESSNKTSTNNATNNGTATNNGGSTSNNTNGSTTNTNNGSTNGTTGSTANNTSGGTNNVCTTPDCECFSNDDCPASMRCEDTGNGVETPRCVEGARGAGVTGDACEAEADCASGVCIGRNDTPNVCSEECDMDNPVCPNDLECVWVPGSGGDEYWCVTPRE